MLVSHRIDNESKIIITTFAPEEANLNIFLETLKDYHADLRYLPEFQKYDELVDFRPITSINITASELKELSIFASSTDSQESITKLALLIDSRPAFTLAKIYEMVRNFNPASKKRVKVFQSMDDALRWLGEEPPAQKN